MTIINQLTQTIEALKQQHSVLTQSLYDITEQASDLYNRVLLYEEAYTESGQAESVGIELDVAYGDYERAYKEQAYQEEQIDRVEQALRLLLEASEYLDEAGV